MIDDLCDDKIILVYSLDFDGAIYNEQYHETKDILASNKLLLETMQAEIEQHNVEEAIIFIGSGRQSKRIDKDNSVNNETGSCFEDIEKICTHLRTKVGEKVKLDKLLIADIRGDLDDGTSFDRARNPETKEEDHSECWPDSIKKILLCTQMHKMTWKYRDKKKIYFRFHDDSFLPILSEINKLFNENSNYIPDNVIFLARFYNGLELFNWDKPIPGTGQKIESYREQAKTMAAEAQNPQEAQKAVRKLPHYTIQEEKEGFSSITLNSTRISDVAIRSAVDRLEQLKREPHASILRFEGCTLHNDKGFTVFYMESCTNQTLLDILGALDQEKILEIALMLINGFIHYEKQKIVPMLIDLNNILVCDDNQLKILDYSITELNIVNMLTLTGQGGGGTPLQGLVKMPPELFKRGYRMDAQSAIFTFGVLLLQMVRKDKALPIVTEAQVRNRAYIKLLNDHIPDTCFDHWKNIISNCFISDPNKRATAADIRLLLLDIKAKANPIKSNPTETLQNPTKTDAEVPKVESPRIIASETKANPYSLFQQAVTQANVVVEVESEYQQLVDTQVDVAAKSKWGKCCTIL